MSSMRISAECGTNSADLTPWSTSRSQNNAPVPQITADERDRLMDTTVDSMPLAETFGLPLLKGGDGPSVVSMTSISGHVASLDFPPAS